MDLNWVQILQVAGAMVAVGLFAGLLAGLLGVGGGIVTVPVLYQVLTWLDVDPGARMHVAVATSLACIVPTSIMSARSHHLRGSLDTALLRSWGPWLFIGSALGAALAGQVGGDALRGVFAVGALVVAGYMLLQQTDAGYERPLPTIARTAAPLAIGGVSTMMGIGGGTFSVPVLRLFGIPIHRAVGTSAAFGLLIAIPGAIGFIISGWAAEGRPPASLGWVNGLALLLLGPAAMLATPWGARLAHYLSARTLRLAFAFFLLATSLRMGASLLMD